MAIVVEDGTGLANADALISVAFLQSYADARGEDYSPYITAQQEQAIVRASDYISESFRWKGFKLKDRGNAAGEQALAWPRSWVTDRNDFPVDDDKVIVEVQKATAIVALYELANPGGMNPTFTPHDRVKMEKIGPIAVEYDLSRLDADGARPVLLAVLDLIGEFLDSSAGSRIAGKTERV